jgi:hypothetical protein
MLYYLKEASFAAPPFIIKQIRQKGPRICLHIYVYVYIYTYIYIYIVLNTYILSLSLSLLLSLSLTTHRPSVRQEKHSGGAVYFSEKYI